MREIEVKIKAKDLKEVEKKLVEKGCQISEPIFQHDTIYNLKGENEDKREGKIILRIRRDNRGAIFTFKQELSNELDNIETETRIEDADAMHKIILGLGFVLSNEVKKVRRKTKLGEYEICLDEVEKLGSFVEIEKLTSDDDDPIKVQEELFKEAESLGLSRDDREVRGYDTQIYQLEHK